VPGDGTASHPRSPVAGPLAETARQLVLRTVGPVEESAPLHRLVDQLGTAARLADREARRLGHRERSALVVSAVLYDGMSKVAACRAGDLTRQAVDQAIQAALGVERLTGPEFERARAERRPDLEIEGAADLLPEAAAAVRFVDARGEAAAAVRDRLVVLVAGRGVTTADLVTVTGLKRAMVDRIRARGRDGYGREG